MTGEMSHPTLQVFFIRDGELARSEVFAEGLYTVGSGDDVDLRLDSDGIEPLHALLEFQNGEVKITAHAASSGIEINGERITSAQINQFDEVKLGQYLLKSRVLGLRPGPRPKVSVAPRTPPPAAPAQTPSRPPPPPAAVRPAAPMAAAPSRPAAATPRMGAAPPVMPRAKAVPPPPPPPEKPIVAKEKGSADLEELDFLFDAALAENSAKAPASKLKTAKPAADARSLGDAPLELDLEESSLLLREVDDAPPAAVETVQIERTQWFEPTPEPQLQLATEPARRRPAQPPPQAVLAKVETTKVRRSGASGAATGLERRAPTGSMLLASIFWGDTLLLAQTFRPGAKVFSDDKARKTLQLYGFGKGAPVVESKGAAWSVVPPTQARSELREGRNWIAAPSGSKELRLEAGAALRLTSGRFHLQLSAEAAPRTAQVMFWQHVDKRLFWLVLLSMVSVWGFILALPKGQRTLPPEIQKELVHNVRMSIEREKKKEKPKPKPVEKKKEEPVLAEKKTPPPVIAQATTLKQAQAAVPIKSLDQLQKATKGLGNLLASLGPSVGKKGGSPSALNLLPTVGSAPAPLPGLGGTGSGGSIGPVTKGSELLRGGGVGGLLGSATAGRGAVQGVPVAMPTKATQVRGSIDRDAVAKVLEEHMNDMRGCYERALMRDPNLGAGKILLEWNISATGAVSDVRTKVATLKNTEVNTCLLDVLKQLQFPKPQGGVVIVSYPFLFNSVGL
jgi:hypothetical protein